MSEHECGIWRGATCAECGKTEMRWAVDAFLTEYGRDGVRALMEAFLRQNGWETWGTWEWHLPGGRFAGGLPGEAVDFELARKETT